MVYNREDALKTIVDGLGLIEASCKLRGLLGLFDNNTISHHFFGRFLNSIYRLNLQVLDRIQTNHPAIDLGDEASGRAFQVTAEKSGEKVQHTLDTFVEHDLHKRFPALQVLIIGQRQAKYSALRIPTSIQFDPIKDIIDTGQLVREAGALDTAHLQELATILRAEITATGSGLEIVDVSFVEDGKELRDPNELWQFRDVYKGTSKEADFLADWVRAGRLHPGEIPMIDVKVRNTSDQPLVIKAAVFNVRRIWDIMPSSLALSHLDISANYDVELPATGAPYEKRVNMSQCVPAKGADRFTFRLRPEFDQRILLVSFDLIYNANDEMTSSHNFLLSLMGYESGFDSGTDEEIQNASEEEMMGIRSEKVRLANNSRVKADLLGIKGQRSKVVRAFEAGKL